MTEPLLLRIMQRVQRLLRSRWFELAGSVLGLGLLAVVLRTALSDVSDVRISPLYSLLAIVGFGGSWIGLAVGWSLLVEQRVDGRPVRRWLRTQLLRYVPGGIWAPIARTADPVHSPANAAKRVALETFGILSSAALVGSFIGCLALDWWWCFVTVGAAAGIVVVVFGVRALGASATLTVRWIALLIVSMSCYAVASAWAQHAVAPGVPFWASAGAGLLSWVAGYLLVVAPGGLGAKEWAYLALLGSLPESTVAIGGLSARLCFVVAELVTLGLVTAGGRLTPSRKRRRAGAVEALPSAGSAVACGRPGVPHTSAAPTPDA